jgi:hypothetical protein
VPMGLKIPHGYSTCGSSPSRVRKRGEYDVS